MIAAASTIIIGLVAAPAGAAESGPGAGEVIPGANKHLTRVELRWCTFEPIRLDGESGEMHACEKWETDKYHARTGVYNEHCVNRAYRSESALRVL